jgi:hypothetical protein
MSILLKDRSLRASEQKPCVSSKMVILVCLGVSVTALAGCRKDAEANHEHVGELRLAGETSTNDAPFTLMPPDAAGFLRINFSEIEKTPIGEIWMSQFPSMGDGVPIEKVACLFFKQLDADVIFTTSAVPYTRARVLMHGEPLEKVHQGKTYYSYANVFSNDQGGTQRSERDGLYFIDDRSFIRAPIFPLHRALEVQSQPDHYKPSATELRLYSQAAHMVASVRMTDDVRQDLKRQFDREWLSLQPLVTQAKTATVVCNLGNPVTVEIEITFGNSAEAQKAVGDLEFAKTLVFNKLNELFKQMTAGKQNDWTNFGTRLTALVSESVRNAVVEKKESSVQVRINADAMSVKSIVAAYVNLVGFSQSNKNASAGR